jgi:membrane-associated protease RseP (regulator of RpoE activity)
MTTIMNNSVSVNELNGNSDSKNAFKALGNGTSTIKCIASTSSIDSSGDFKINRQLECMSTNQGGGINCTLLDLEISGIKGNTPEVTVNGQEISGGSVRYDASGNLEVRSCTGQLLDIVKVPAEYLMATNENDVQNNSGGKTAPSLPVNTAFLGIAVRPASSDLAHNLVVDASNVCVISEVVPGSPAFSAGLEPNDVILGINGKPANPSALLHDLKIAGPGQSLKMIILCKGVASEVEVTLGTNPWKNKQPSFKAENGYPVNPANVYGSQGCVQVQAQDLYNDRFGYPLGSTSPSETVKTWLSAGTLM